MMLLQTAIASSKLLPAAVNTKAQILECCSAVHGVELNGSQTKAELIEQARLAITTGIEAEVPQRALALLMEAMGNAHQPHPIAEVMLQGPGDAAAQIGSRRLARSAAGGGAKQGLTGHLDQILPLHQREQAPGGD